MLAKTTAFCLDSTDVQMSVFCMGSFDQGLELNILLTSGLYTNTGDMSIPLVGIVAKKVISFLFSPLNDKRGYVLFHK